MKNRNAPENQTTRRILLIACATALAVAFTVSLPQLADADHVTPPPVPANIQVPAGNKAFLEGHAVGTQNYICLPCPNPTTPRCVPTSPASPGYSSRRRPPCSTTMIGKSSPTSSAPTRLRITQSRSWPPDDSRHVAGLAGHEHRLGHDDQSSSDPAFVAPGAIAWLLLEVVGAEDGPTGGDTLTATTFVQRLNTSGGIAPSTGCTSLQTSARRRSYLTRPTTSSTGRPPKGTRTTATRISAQAVMWQGRFN